MATRANLLRDLLFFIKDNLNGDITDPISANRPSKSAFVMTSYPSRPVNYPIVTIKITDISGRSWGLQSTDLGIILEIEIRVWARNEKEKDEIYNSIIHRLANIQYTAGGSILNDLHDFRINNTIEIDEEGEQNIKSRIATIQYKFYG